MERAAHRSTPGSSNLRIGVVAALVVLTVGAGAGLWHTRPGREQSTAAPAATCEEELTARVVVVPALAGLVTQFVDGESDDCSRITVESREARATFGSLEAGQDVPDLWVSDAPWLVAELADSGAAFTSLSDAVATTPVMLVGGPRAAQHDTWAEALASGTVAIPDPASSLGSLVLTAPEAAGMSGPDAQELLVPVAQSFGERRTGGREQPLDVATLTAADTRLIPITEATFKQLRPGNDLMRSVTPGEGVPLIRFPVYASSEAATGAIDLGERMVKWLASPPGTRQLGRAGFRHGDGTAIAPGGVGRASTLPQPSARRIDLTIRNFSLLATPSSILAVFDVSGSMEFLAGDRSRMQLALDLARLALSPGIFPDHARIGLWVFSINQGGPGRDWRELVPMRRLGARVGDLTQRQVLEGKTDQMLAMTTGGTGLYDTTLAAYRRATREFDPNYGNSVVLITDGANEDPGSIGLPALLRRLEALHDPARPIRIIGIGISEDADAAALRQIAEVTDGNASVALDPNDVVDVFVEALASR